MANIPAYADWMKQTELRFKPRSSELKKLDDAIKACGPNGSGDRVTEVRKALGAWKRAKGENWKMSERNKGPVFPFTALAKAVYVDLKLPPAEQAALDFWDDSRRRKIQTIFAGKQVKLRLVNTVSQLAMARRDLEGVSKGLSGAAGAAGKAALDPEVTKAVNDMFGTQIRELSQLGAQAAAQTGAAAVAQAIEHVTSMIPFICLIADGAKVLFQWGQAIQKGYKIYEFSTHSNAIERGDPAAAFDAVRMLLIRETVNQVSKASITTVAFGANTALHAAKGAGAVLAPVVGAAKAAANAARVIAKFALEYRETVLVNRVLKQPENLDLRIFKICPLLGAYMLICSDTSDLIAMLFDEFGQAGWMDDIEHLVKKHIHPAQDRAADLVQSSPFIIPGVPLHRRATANLANMSMLTNFL